MQITRNYTNFPIESGYEIMRNYSKFREIKTICEKISTFAKISKVAFVNTLLTKPGLSAASVSGPRSSFSITPGLKGSKTILYQSCCQKLKEGQNFSEIQREAVKFCFAQKRKRLVCFCINKRIFYIDQKFFTTKKEAFPMSTSDLEQSFFKI